MNTDLSPDAPWKRRFRAWSIASAAVASREPSRGIVTCNRSGVHQIYAWDVLSGDLRQLTFKPAGKPAASLSPDGRFVYYLDDEEGNELGHVVRVPYRGGEAIDLTPDMPPYALSALAMSRDGSALALTTATREGFHTYVSDFDGDETGELRLIFHTTPLMRGVHLSYDGSIAVLGLTERSRTTDVDLVAVDSATGDRIGELYDHDASVTAVRFSRVPEDERILCQSNVSGNGRPLIWHSRTGVRVDLPFDEVPGEVIPVDWSEDARRLLLMHVNEAVQRLAVYDIERQVIDWLNHPSGMIYSAHFAPNGEIFALMSDSTRPSRMLALDEATGAEKRVLLQGEEAPPGVKWRSISYPSTAGATIQAWVATPPNDPPYPTILDIHGGPTAATFEFFSPRVQAFVDHGFAVLSINYRGSTTFGREFQNCIRGHLGDWEVDDIGAAYEWLVADGIAKPEQVFLQGGSYGGYLTLLGLGRLPDLWAGGMAMVAIADWVLMYEDQAETLRGYQVGLFGGTPEEKPEQHAKASPITYAEDVGAPLLVIQGKNDTRCPSRQMEAYHEKMLELGKNIDLRWFEAGHGSYAIEQNIEHMEWMLVFAHNVIAAHETAAV